MTQVAGRPYDAPARAPPRGAHSSPQLADARDPPPLAMRSRQKIAIDRWVGLPMVWGLNLVTRALGVLLRRNHSASPDSVGTIVVAKYLGMGSILHATPLLRALRDRYPKARLVFVSARSNRELLERLPLIDERMYVDDRSLVALASSTWATLAALQRARVDLYFDLEVYSAYASLVALLSVARNRIGFYRYSTAFKRGIYTHLIYFNTHQPIRCIYLQLGRAVGARAPADESLGPLHLRDEDRLGLARKLVTDHGLDPETPYVVVNPNASDLLLERRWPAERFAALVGGLARDGRRVVLIGSGDEAAHTGKVRGMVAASARASLVDTAGTLTLGELLALLSGAACVVSNDTGPMHMAIALGRPTVCLFGPCSPAHYGVEQPGVETLYHRVFCSPCVHEVERPPCAGDNVCMQLIGADEALAAVRRAVQAHTLAQAAHAEGARVEAVVRCTDEASEADPRGVAALDAHGFPLGVVVRESVPPR